MNKILSLAAAWVLAAGPASAHVTLETATAAVGTTYKAVLRIPPWLRRQGNRRGTRLHTGRICGGKAHAQARLDDREGRYAYAAEYELQGRKMTEGVTEISWSGGSLADDEYDEFVFRGTLDGSLEAGKAIYFPVIQSCGLDAIRWTEVPAEGQVAHEPEFPAPGLELTHAEHAGH